MTIVDIGMLTGFIADQTDLKAVRLTQTDRHTLDYICIAAAADSPARSPGYKRAFTDGLMWARVCGITSSWRYVFFWALLASQWMHIAWREWNFLLAETLCSGLVLQQAQTAWRLSEAFFLHGQMVKQIPQSPCTLSIVQQIQRSSLRDDHSDAKEKCNDYKWAWPTYFIPLESI